MPPDRIDRTADERRTLDHFLDIQRATLLRITDGLTADQLRRPLPTSELTLAGLLKHLTLVEDDWIHSRFLGRPELEPWASAPWAEDPDWEFHTALADEPADLRGRYRLACARSRAGLDGVGLDVLSIGTDPAGEPWNLRWILTHLIEETARHNGHADLLREAVDGHVGE